MTSVTGALRASRMLLTTAAIALGAVLAPMASAQTTFSNTTAITIPATGTGGAGALGVSSPYSSDIAVSGMTGAITNVSVTLSGISHTFPDDIDVLLVGPNGEKYIIMSDCGGGVDMTGETITLDDAGAALLTTGTLNPTGTYKPSNYGTGDSFFTPAPAGPYTSAATAGTDTFASVFNGHAPNGTWSLYVIDDGAADIGTIAGGWSITITAAGDPGSVTTISSSLNPSAPGDNVTITSTTTVSGSPATAGTVEFKEGATTLAGPTAVDSNGQASFSTSSLSAGAHTITAFYSGSAGVAQPSSASFVQVVNPFGCNFAPIIINDNAVANPYPSTITISGFSGNIANLKVQLLGFSHTFPDDANVLLVGPTGQTVVLMQNAGGADDVTNIDLTFDDTAGAIPDATILSTGSYAPAAYGTAVYPAPAPGPAYGTTLAGFNGTDPNGIWSLYVVDDAGADIGQFGGGWCLMLTPDIQVVSPFDYLVTQGGEFGGGLASLLSSDDVRLQILNDETSLLGQVEFYGTTTVLAPSQLVLKMEHQALRTGLSYVIDQFNYQTNAFDASSGGVAPISDLVSTITLTGSAANHVGGGGELKARITWGPINDEDPAQDGWPMETDHVEWTLSP